MTSAPSAPHQRDGHVDRSDTPLSVDQLGPDVVEIELPADPAYLGVVRTACAGLGARLDLTLDEIEDLRIAVDEACTLVLPAARSTTPSTAVRLRATFRVSDDALAVRVQGPNPALPVETSYAWAVLEALAGDVSSGVEAGGSWISLAHSRARAA
ncbi:ATP-binding protein [Aquipuribacter hungaricus]|uniref:ATP-binding protein n=1 Tax=Aquipuribacter hungaricus TaxID=545624 RepID=A0ABV7WJH6_9MICO